MKKKNKIGMILLIIIAFVAGIAAEILLRRFLPALSPDMSVELVSFLAMAARIVSSVVIVFLGVLMKGDR